MTSERLPVSREKLYEEIWTEPTSKVAARYQVSGSYLTRVCDRLNIPRPPKGYWAQHAVGKAPKRIALPNARPGDEVEWSPYGIAGRAPMPLPKAPIRLPTDKIKIPTKRTAHHALIGGAKGFFEGVRETDEGYLKPAKKNLLDITVTKGTLDHALDMANELYLALEDRGHRVTLEPSNQIFTRPDLDEREEWPQGSQPYRRFSKPCRPTVVFIGSVAIGLMLFELSKNIEVKYVNGKYIPLSDLPPRVRENKHSLGWTTNRDLPTGRLCLQVYSPYQETKWIHRWNEEKLGSFKSLIAPIIQGLERDASKVAELAEEADRNAKAAHQKWEEQKRRWDIEEAERKRNQAIKDSKSELEKIIEEWGELKRIEAFFDEVVQSASFLEAEQQAQIHERVRHAKSLLGNVNALKHFMNWSTPQERLNDHKPTHSWSNE